MVSADPAGVVEVVLRRPELQAGLTETAAEQDRPVDELRAEARACLHEMVAVHDERASAVFDRMGSWFARAYGVELDAAVLRELRAANERYGVVFLPAHKSYLDPVVLQPALTRAGFPRTHLLGGINLSFWPMGPLARRTGVIYIRRRFSGDPVYKLCVRAYFRHLVDHRDNLEWYIEGGRSRTGKLRPPRLGLLAYLTDAVRESPVEDVLLVPVSIVYDQLHEVALMAAEQRGGRKTPEGLGWLYRFGKAQSHGLGTAHVRFGEPLRVRSRLSGPHAVDKLAFEVSHRINQATPITATALVTLALLGMKGRALTLPDVCGILEPLLEYVAVRKLPTAGAWEFATPADVERTLDQLVATGVVTRFADGREPVYAVHPERDLEAAFYRNSAIHFFVNRAITELVVAGLAAGEPVADPMAAAWADALAMRDLLKFEFFFGSKAEFAEQLREELAIVDPDWDSRGGDPAAAAAGLRRLRMHLAHRVLRSFLEAYRVVADQLVLTDAGPLDADAFVAGCVPVARQYHLQHRIHSSESISEELFRTALKLAANRGLLDVFGEDLPARRAAFAAEIRDVLARVEAISQLAA